MGKTVHAAIDGNPEESGDDEVSNVVVIEDLIWDKVDRDLGVFGAGKGSSEKEILEVKSEESGFGVRDDAVDKEFRGYEVCCLGRDGARVIDSITTDGDSDSLRFFLLGAVSDNYT